MDAKRLSLTRPLHKLRNNTFFSVADETQLDLCPQDLSYQTGLLAHKQVFEQ